MNQWRLSVPAVFLLALATAPAADLASEADRIARFYHEEYQFNGTVLVSRAGEVVFKGAYGMADREWGVPHSTDTRFRIGSITKQFTAALILQLVAEGKVELEAPLSRYVPEYPAKVADRVTVHHLLTHTSGIKSYTSMPNFRDEVSRNPYTPVEFLEVFANEPLDFEPGEKFLYNNSGYFLLGVIVEKVTEKPYEDVLRERIFEPLGMQDSGYDRADALIEKRAAGYDARLDGYRNSPYLDMSLPYAAGSLYSTVEDLYKWDRALAAGTVPPDEMSEKMFARHVTVSPAPDAPSYGYGWFIEERDGKELVGHGGGINGFNTLIQRIPEEGHLVVLLNNSPGANLQQMFGAILPLLHGEDAGPLKRSGAAEVYRTYEKDGVEAAALRWKEIEEADDYLSNPAEAARLVRAIVATDPGDARKLLEMAGLTEKPQSAGLWMMLGDALAGKGLRDEAATAYATALKLGPGMADAVANKLKELPERKR